MDLKEKFNEIMKGRHSERKFLKKEIPANTLKEIISLHYYLLLKMEYIASGNTLEEIKKIWISKNKENTKVMLIFLQKHRTDFSETHKKQWIIFL